MTSPFELQILDRVISRFSDAELARAWYRSVQIPGFGGMTAKQMVEAGLGTDVFHYIDAVDAGVFA